MDLAKEGKTMEGEENIICLQHGTKLEQKLNKGSNKL